MSSFKETGLLVEGNAKRIDIHTDFVWLISTNAKGFYIGIKESKSKHGSYSGRIKQVTQETTLGTRDHRIDDVGKLNANDILMTNSKLPEGMSLIKSVVVDKYGTQFQGFRIGAEEAPIVEDNSTPSGVTVFAEDENLVAASNEESSEEDTEVGEEVVEEIEEESSAEQN